MKKIVLLCIVSVLLLYANTRSLISKIPLPETIIIDMYDGDECSLACLQMLYNEGKYFTFLSLYRDSEDLDQDIRNSFQELKIALNLQNSNSHFRSNIDFTKFQSNSDMKIALLVPRKIIGKYSIGIANSILSYLIYKNIKFDFEVFDCNDESEDSIQKALFDIKNSGYQFVVAALTPNGANIVSNYENDLLIFIPTVNAKYVQNQNSNIFFGGIDYQKQIDILLGFANERVAIFDDKSKLAQEISQTIKENSSAEIVYEQNINNIKTNISYMIKANKDKLEDSSIFLNLPLVKSALVASQLSSYKIKPYALLSTQVNYHPMLFTLTQKQDIEQLYIANSISEQDLKLKEINILLGTNPSYSWIDYSTAIGVDYVYTQLISIDTPRLFFEPIENNQITYKIRVFQPENFGFKELFF